MNELHAIVAQAQPGRIFNNGEKFNLAYHSAVDQLISLFKDAGVPSVTAHVAAHKMITADLKIFAKRKEDDLRDLERILNPPDPNERIGG
jgi:hypothetical protein